MALETVDLSGAAGLGGAPPLTDAFNRRITYLRLGEMASAMRAFSEIGG